MALSELTELRQHHIHPRSFKAYTPPPTARHQYAPSPPTHPDKALKLQGRVWCCLSLPWTSILGFQQTEISGWLRQHHIHPSCFKAYILHNQRPIPIPFPPPPPPPFPAPPTSPANAAVVNAHLSDPITDPGLLIARFRPLVVASLSLVYERLRLAATCCRTDTARGCQLPVNNFSGECFTYVQVQYASCVWSDDAWRAGMTLHVVAQGPCWLPSRWWQ